MVEQSVSRGALTLYYFKMLIFCMIVAIAIGAAILYFAKISMAGSGIGILLPMFAAALTGQRYYRRTGALPQGGFAWQMAVRFSFVALAVNIALFGFIFASGVIADVAPNGPDTEEVLVIGIVCVAAALIFLLVNRFGFGMGAKNAQKRTKTDSY